MVFLGGGAYGSLPDAALWWCLRTGGGGVLTTVEYAVLAMSHDMLSRNRVAKSAKVVGKVFSIVPTSTHF